MLRFLTLAWAVVLLAACATPPPLTGPGRPLTILISIDGFRADYLDRGMTPVLSGLAADGARGVMRPSFPTMTFPNHYTLVTGLRPDRHGIVDNIMEDPDIPGVTFRMSNAQAVADRRWWDQGEPIWVRAERAGIVTATMFWPGSGAPIQGVRPRHWRPFDQAVSSDAREPGQNMVAVTIPARSARTQIGSPWSHQRRSVTAWAFDIRKVTPGMAGSCMVLSTTPCRSGRSPVTRV